MFSRTVEHIVIDGHRIEEVSQTKFLGVILDNKLNWTAHCNYICCKMSKGIGIIIKARKVFNQTTLLSLNNSLILPSLVTVFTYGEKHMTHIWKMSLYCKRKFYVLLMVYHHVHILTTCLFSLISSQSKSTASVLLVLLCINMIMECYFNYFVIFSLLEITLMTMKQDKLKVRICMFHSDLLLEARNLLHLVVPWCGILLYPKWILAVLYFPSRSFCGRYHSCVPLLIYLDDYVSPDYDSQTIEFKIV